MSLERAVSQSCVGRSLLFILRIVHGVDKTQNFKLLNLALPKVTTRLNKINFVELATKRKIIVVYISQRNCSVSFFEMSLRVLGVLLWHAAKCCLYVACLSCSVCSALQGSSVFHALAYTKRMLLKSTDEKRRKAWGILGLCFVTVTVAVLLEIELLCNFCVCDVRVG
jgi:hypothetical protein